MGGDGGQVIDRATMVKTKGWGLTKGSGDRYAASLGEMNSYVQMIFEDRGLGTLERHRVRMSTCMISQEALRDPVVACKLGNLYNKEAVIAALLNRKMPEDLSHIRALKDVKQCMVTWAEAEKEEGQKRMVCPVSREDLDSGSSRAVLIWPSGAVISAKSLKEMKMKECPLTSKPFDADKDVIPLAPDGEELKKLRERLPTKKRKAQAVAAPAEAEEAAPSIRAPTAAADGSVL
ncbi:rtf2 [Symbiodinium pilosum]|uniref:Rtf2 protein n=1 Tax=Symbiodinium pilosum TaxID=2952 RepID=A0A812Q2L5_SYMPI|nr:rtf2 [Symbiodinium pilosum]